MKKTIKLIILSLMLIVPTFAELPHPIITLNGMLIQTDVSPFVMENRTMVPIRFISEALGYKVDWEESTKKVSITDAKKSLILIIGNPDYIININGNEEKKSSDVAPIIRQNRTFVPLRFIAEEFGMNIEWDDNLRVVILGDKKNYNEVLIEKIKEVRTKEKIENKKSNPANKTNNEKDKNQNSKEDLEKILNVKKDIEEFEAKKAKDPNKRPKELVESRDENASKLSLEGTWIHTKNKIFSLTFKNAKTIYNNIKYDYTGSYDVKDEDGDYSTYPIYAKFTDDGYLEITPGEMGKSSKDMEIIYPKFYETIRRGDELLTYLGDGQYALFKLQK